jgi:uncharacterized protein (TIGR01777 family)
MHVFVTGGTGLIGTRIIRRLLARNDAVSVLTRRPSSARDRLPGITVVEGDPTQLGTWMDAVAACDAVINLAGEGIMSHRWNDDFKKRLRDSRLKTTEHIVQAVTKNPRGSNGQAKALVNASAIGYYGFHGDEELDENSPAGDDFLARLCVDWERAASAAEAAGVRVARVRIGVVLDKEGGALGKMLLPFKLGAGGPVGNGRQFMSWIHHDDLASLFLLALDRQEVTGPINGTAPRPVTNREFGQALGRALHRPAFMPTPALALRLMLGEAAELVTKGQRVLPRRAEALGYSFRFATIDDALREILGE